MASIFRLGPETGKKMGKGQKPPSKVSELEPEDCARGDFGRPPPPPSQMIARALHHAPRILGRLSSSALSRPTRSFASFAPVQAARRTLSDLPLKSELEVSTRGRYAHYSATITWIIR